jgi:signal transduction histidine kinase
VSPGGHPEDAGAGKSAPEVPARVAGKRHRSLASRYLAIVIVVELVFGGVVATAVSAYTLQRATAEHREARRLLSVALAASLVGEMRGPDPIGLAAAVDAVTGHAGPADIVAVTVLDPSGETVHTRGDVPAGAVEAREGRSFSDLWTPSIQRARIFEGGRFLGTLEIIYAPIGIGNIIGFPLTAILILVLVAVVFSSLMTTWLVSSTIAAPIAKLRDSAAAIAEGRRDVPLPIERADELGELARGISEMIDQLGEREQELTDSYRSLEGAYNRQATLKEDLTSALRTRSDFVAVASHEIRNPLAVIRMYAEMLQEGEYGELAGPQAEAVGSISAASARLSSIVADLMDVALLDRGLMPLSFGEVAIDTLVEQTVRDQTAMGAAMGVEVFVACCPEHILVHADELRVRQVLDNLLDNALKYADGSPVSVSLVEGDGHVEVRVADRGPGIPEDRRGLLFEAFRRVETGDDSGASGLGLGLAISRRIAEAHGGTITVEDNVADGRGTVFVLKLPYHGDQEGGSTARISVV